MRREAFEAVVGRLVFLALFSVGYFAGIFTFVMVSVLVSR